jgi:hypothetical protein
VPETPDTLAAKIIALRAWIDMRLASLDRRFDATDGRLDRLAEAIVPPRVDFDDGRLASDDDDGSV